MRCAAVVVIVLAVSCGRGGGGAPEERGAAASGEVEAREAHSDGWHRQEVPECGFSVEIPGPGQRDEVDLGGGYHTIGYTVKHAADVYIVDCITPPAGRWTPEAALRDRFAAHGERDFPDDMRARIVDQGTAPAPDGGSYWFAFDSGVRIEGRVHLLAGKLADLNGSVTPHDPDSRAALDRVLESYRAR